MLAKMEFVVDCLYAGLCADVDLLEGELLRLAGCDRLLPAGRVLEVDGSTMSSKGTPTAVSASVRRKPCASIVVD